MNSKTITLLLFITTTTILVEQSTTSIFAFPIPPPLLHNPWLPFKNLTGCHRGITQQGLANLKNYLHHFGYLPPSNFTDDFDDTLESAVKTYQQNFNLNITGQLDEDTVNQIMSPRCGIADIINGTSTMKSSALHGRNLYSYFPGSPSWPASKRDLKYAITDISEVSIDMATLQAVFASAFSKWSAATTLTFTETDNAEDADITIGFHNGAHGDGEPFDGVLGTLAHAFSPTDGRFHLDAAESWFAGGDVRTASSDDAVDLESVAVHEIGHLLGLGHSSVEDAIMFPTIRTRTSRVELASDDVDGIQMLYGSNPSYTAPTTTSTTSSEEKNGGGVGGMIRSSVWKLGLGWMVGFVVIIGLL